MYRTGLRIDWQSRIHLQSAPFTELQSHIPAGFSHVQIIYLRFCATHSAFTQWPSSPVLRDYAGNGVY